MLKPCLGQAACTARHGKSVDLRNDTLARAPGQDGRACARASARGCTARQKDTLALSGSGCSHAIAAERMVWRGMHSKTWPARAAAPGSRRTPLAPALWPAQAPRSASAPRRAASAADGDHKQLTIRERAACRPRSMAAPNMATASHRNHAPPARHPSRLPGAARPLGARTRTPQRHCRCSAPPHQPAGRPATLPYSAGYSTPSILSSTSM